MKKNNKKNNSSMKHFFVLLIAIIGMLALFNLPVTAQNPYEEFIDMTDDYIPVLISGIFRNSPLYATAMDGDVGLGTTSPGAKLDVSGNVHVSNDLTVNSDTNVGTLSFNDATAHGDIIMNDNKITNLKLVPTANSDAATKGYVDASSPLWVQVGDDIYYIQGNVGIGTASPGIYRLNVNGTSYFVGNIALANNALVDGVDISDYSPYFIDSAGTNGQVWKSDGSGRGAWAADETGSGGDNLGNHIATQNLDMNNNRIENVANPDSGDDAMDRDYADARYINVGESGDSIADGTIDSSEIQDNTLTASDLAANSVGASEIAASAVGTAEIQDGTIQEIDLEATNAPTDNDILSYDSGTAGFTWVPDTSGSSSIPSGIITAYGGTSAPSGWFLCNGAAVSRITYADLFAVIGTTYGVGDGATTFNVPNLQQRFPLGKATSGTGSSLGSSGGVIDHTHTYSEVIAHTHTVNPPSTTSSTEGGDHRHVVNPPATYTNYAGVHNHYIPSSTSAGDGGVQRVQSGSYGSRVTDNAGSHRHTVDIASFYSGYSSDSHSHSVNIPAFTSGSTGVATGTTHSSNPPYLVVNYIIKS